MRRRHLWTLLGGIEIAWPFAARAQSRVVRRLGVLSPFSPSTTAQWLDALRLGLRDLGWIEGSNIVIHYRYAEGRNDRLAALAAELVTLDVEIILASTGTDAVAVSKASRTIPIVVASSADLVGVGLAKSLSRPGGNVTGLSQITLELGGKRLQLLKEIVPTLSRAAVLWNPSGAVATLGWDELQSPARQLGIELHSLEAQTTDDFRRAFEDAARFGVTALVIMPNPLFAGNLARLAALAVEHRMASIFHLREYVDAGGLIAYGVDRSDMFRRAAGYVDKILKGARPAELPIEQPTKFELVVNLRTAKALGLVIPPAILASADEVIE